MRKKASSISAIVDDGEWQALRLSFLGTWMTNGDENTAKLRAYLGSAANKPRSHRFIRVLNYLTGSGFRSGRIKSKSAARLLSELRQVKRSNEHDGI